MQVLNTAPSPIYILLIVIIGLEVFFVGVLKVHYKWGVTPREGCNIAGYIGDILRVLPEMLLRFVN